MNNLNIVRSIEFTISFILAISFEHVNAQPAENLPQVISPSPNAASLGIYGQVPVSLFSGLVRNSIPIGSVTAGDLNVPITLNYRGGGIRPDIHPSWVGLGWDLNAGGMITRKMNGGLDEILTLNGNPEERYGYYYQYYRADNNNWASVDTLANDLQTYTSYTKVAYPAPDEFIFNFGNYSGSFFYNHKGKWQIKSESPINLKVEEQVKDNYVLASQGYTNKTLRRIFYKFTLTTPDGNKYIFGGTDQSIEFTRDGESGIAQDAYGDDILPTSWYLTKIISRTGQEVDLQYERDSIQCLLSSNILKSYYDNVTTQKSVTDMHHISVAIVNPVYLTRIDGPNQTVKFNRSLSTELSYDYISNGVLAHAALFTDLSNNNNAGQVVSAIKFYKLDSVSFYADTATYLKKTAFYYPQQSNIRLRLDSLKEFGTNGNAKPAYSFLYNSTVLPPYNSQKFDHWGYYNGQYFFTLFPKNPESLYSYTDISNYSSSRNPVSSMMQAGMLTDIKYPTGGVTSFEYEPHQYSKIAKRFPFVVTDTNANIMCGGLRIKKIVNKDAAGNLLSQREFLYVRNYKAGGSVSSGILGGYPQYLTQGQFAGTYGTVNYWEWFDYSIEPLSFTDGNHVTYSEVVEKQYDSGYSVFTYSNHDQGTYRDELPINGIANDPNIYKFDPSTSRSLERGKLLSQLEYNSNNVLLRKRVFDYDTSAPRFAEAVRMIYLKSRKFGEPPFGGDYEKRGTSYLIYTFPHFLIRQIDSLWDQSGINPVANVHNYLYNSYRLMTVDSSVNSVQQITKITFKYPFDMLPGNDPTGVYQKMVDSNVIEPIIERKNFVNAIQQSLLRTNYYQPYNWLFSPQMVEVQDRTNPIETRLRYYNYDTKGNLLSVSKENDAPTSYVWGYKQTLPIAEVKNATQADIAYTSFESDNTGNWNNYSGLIVKATQAGMPPSGRKYYTLTSNPLLKSGLTSAKTYVVSYWTQNGGPYLITGTITGFPKAGRSLNGWNYFEHKVTGQTNITISGSGVIDEVRLYPSTAMMSTYTYEPVIGMSAKIDQNSQVTYYEYDELQRLSLVRDQDRNILQKICYNYAGQPSDCKIHYNSAQSGIFKRNVGCGCNIGTNVTYTVPANTYSSPISPADANQKAINDVNANGQAYANANGSCVAPATAPITGQNSTSKSVDIEFHNNCTGVNSYYTLSANSTSVSVPNQVEGNYNVKFTPLGASGALFTFIVNGQTLAHFAQGTISNVNLSSGSNTLVVF